MSFTPVRQLAISIDFGNEKFFVGNLFSYNNRILFEYDQAFLAKGLQISPINCPLKSGVQTFNKHWFEGLPGVFNDSIPDWLGKAAT